MNLRILHLLLVLSSLIGYLEWGQGQHMFLAQGEWDVLSKLFTDPMSVLHPFTLLPMAGQVLLLINVFRKQPNQWLTWLGIGCISVLFLMMFFIGIIGPQGIILTSTLPFLGLSVWVILQMRKPQHEPEPPHSHV